MNSDGNEANDSMTYQEVPPTKFGKGSIITGYIFAVGVSLLHPIGSLVGIFIGDDLQFATTQTENGKKFYKYDQKSRKHGRIIFVIGVILMAVVGVAQCTINVARIELT